VARHRRGDELYLTLARRWSKVMITLFAVGVVTGTVLSFEMGLLWPRFVGTFGPVFGLGFAIERFSVFLEIRARLFISPRTVEYHLHEVFGMWQ
jgi:cytochrome d ubiquinol oxidase subunit I